MMRKNGVPERIFNEVKSMANFKFIYCKTKDPVKKSCELAELASSYPIEDLNRIGTLHEYYENDKYIEMIKKLTASNLLLFLIDSDHEELPLAEEIFKTPYSLEPLLDYLAQKIDFPNLSEELKKQISYPKVNKFIPENFDIVNKVSESNKLVELIFKDEKTGDCFHKIDNTFSMPYMHVNFYFFLEINGIKNPINYIYQKIWIGTFGEFFNPYLYQAEMGELKLQTYCDFRGLELNFNSDKIPFFIQKVVKKMIQFNSDQDIALLKKLYNKRLNKT